MKKSDYQPADSPTIEPSPLMTRAQAADELGVTTRTIDYHRVRGHLKPYNYPIHHGRGGTRIFFRREDVQALKQPRVERPSKGAK